MTTGISYPSLGHSGLKVAPLWLGTMMFGGQTDEAGHTVASAREAGAIETEVLPCCAHYGVGVVSYSPLARGVLTGKYKPGEAPAAGTRAARADSRLMQTAFRPESLALSQQFAAHAERRRMTASQFATAWVLNNRLVAGVIAGPRTLAQWNDYVGALALKLDAEDEAFIDGLVPAGHASTHGYTDPVYPVTGRMAKGGST